jgi:hypothetical protein
MAKTVSSKKNPKRVLIVISIVAVLLVGALLLSMYLRQTSIFSSINSSSSPESIPMTPTTPEQQTPGVDGNYLTIQDWGVKFEIPLGLNGIKYYKVANHDSYEFTTKRVEDLGDQCNTSTTNETVIRIGGVSRRDTPRPESQYTAPYPLNNNNDLGGKYYTYSMTQSSCSTNDPNGFQQRDRQLLEEMFMTIQSS